MQLFPHKIDLHLHSALSPCAEKEMTPPKIIHAARAKGLKMIAITDHNTAENAGATIEAAKESGIFVIPGMEVQTREEVHVICLFPSLSACLSWQKTVYQSLPKQDNRPEVFGSQQVLDRNGQLIRELPQMLLVSTNMPVETVAAEVANLGGICIPAHIDRPSYSLMATLGFVPDGLPVGTMELSGLTSSDEAAILFPSLSKYTFVSSSDAHCLTDLGSNPSTIYCAEPPDFDELKQALAKISGRKVLAKMKDLSMHIIDIVQNSLEAGATTVKLLITEDTGKDNFTIEIADNGRGMDEETMAKVIDPFFTTRKTRRIGLGVPLLKAAAERCDGSLELDSSPGKGTRVIAIFRHSHIDRAPLGNIIDAVVNLVVSSPELDLFFCHKINDQEITFDAKELREQLEDVPLSNPAVMGWIKKYLTESYNDLS
jgi:anti-sigma regulatory factor (Ser/Thr protein kinase)